MAPTPTAASRMPFRTRLGPRNTARTVRATSAGAVARSSSASPSSCVPLGSGRGSQRWPPSGGAEGVGRCVEEHGDDVDARDAVHERVVGLGQEREAVVLETLDDPDLPERLVAVELLREDAAGQVHELALRARGGQRGRADVVAQVQMRVVHPARAPLAERDEGEALAVARDEPEAALDGLQEVVVGGRGSLEEHHRRHVHVRGRVLDVQERCVQPAQTVPYHGSSFGECSKGSTVPQGRGDDQMLAPNRDDRHTRAELCA